MNVEVNTTVTVDLSLGRKSYLQEYICELMYAPGKTRPEVFLLPRDTQPGTMMPLPNGFITVVERLHKPE